MSQDIPKEFFENLYGGREITNFSISSGSKAGDNFTSVLLSVDFTFKENLKEKKHLIIKIFPESEDQRRYLIQSQIFKKEIEVYRIWFEELKNLIKGTRIHGLPYPPFVKGNASESFSEDKPLHILDNYLLMENVKFWDFKMSESKLLDLDHCQLLFKEVAKVHAISWAYKEKNELASLKTKFPFLEENSCTPKARDILQNFLNRSMAKFLKTLEIRFGLDSEIYKSYENWSKRDIIGELLAFCEDPIDLEKLETFLKKRSFTPEEISNCEPWKLTNHSDLWTNNLLFHYDGTGKPDQVILLDFQYTSEQCPTRDLAFFTYISTSLETRKFLPKLLKLYHQEFLKILKEFPSIEPPEKFQNFEHFLKRFRTSQYFGLISSVLWFPLSYEASLDEAKELFDFDSNSEQKLVNCEIEPAKVHVAKYVLDLAQEFYDEEII